MVARPSTVQEELDLLANLGKGLLKPEAVVDYAKDPETALHSRFEWDDTRAGHQYRLEQARHMIRLWVFVPRGKTEQIRVWANLERDRVEPGGGYRRMTAVLRSKTLREEFLAQALREFELFEARFRTLRELAPLFSTMREIEGEIRQRSSLRERKARSTRAAKRVRLKR